LKTDICLFEVISSIQALGIDLRDEKVTYLIKDILNKKIEFTKENHAWEQYQHLALWLTYLNSIIHLSDSGLKEIILECTNISLSNCAEKGTWGTPWEATKEWQESWSNIIPSNRLIIKEYSRENLKEILDAIYFMDNEDILLYCLDSKVIITGGYRGFTVWNNLNR